MSNLLKRCTIAVTGDFGETREHDKIKQWIRFSGGKFTTKINSRVTHLICSKQHFKRDVVKVEQARIIKTIKIVLFDWLEDTLLKNRLLNEREYLLGPRAKAEAATKAKKKIIRKENIRKGMESFEKGVRNFEQDMNSKNYSIYYDPMDNFAYDITLVRWDLCTNENERYHLKLYITHDTPKYFACYVKYSAPRTRTERYELSPIGSDWETSFGSFKQFFKLKTGKEWDERLRQEEKVTSVEKLGECYVYLPPRKGESRGMWTAKSTDIAVNGVGMVTPELPKEWTESNAAIWAEEERQERLRAKYGEPNEL